MKYILSLLVFTTFISCSSTVRSEYANFTIPSGFSKIKPNKEYSEILKLKYKNEMYIIVQDDLGDIVKKSSIGSLYTMKMAHSIKYMMMKTKYQGFNESESKSYTVNGRNVIEQEFAANESIGNIYYRYYIVEVKDHYLEVIITGKANMKTKQQAICDEFIGMIQSNPT